MPYDFDILVIGGGAAGLTAAGVSATLGAKTALVEAHRLGGDCTWTGCVPSKTLLKAAKVAHAVRTADRFGLRAGMPSFDFGEVMRHVHAIQNRIYEHVDAPPILESLGVKVIFARAKFLDRRRLELTTNEGTRSEISSRYVIVAAGSQPAVPPIEGLAEAGYLTNETVFSLMRLPSSLIVAGAGAVGVEMAQAFRRLGSEVTVLDFENRILPRDDPELSAQLRQALEAEGIRFLLESTVKKVEKTGSGARVLAENPSGSRVTAEGEALLLSLGRRASVEPLDLKAAGVEFDRAGIRVDNHCRTSAKNIFACGDVTGGYQFTHMAEHMAKVAVTNALLHLPVSVDSKHVTWCTFTDPELAHLGASEEELRKNGARYEVYRFPFSRLDRAVTENETVGLVKVLAKSFSGKILGASILGANAGEMIGEYALAMRNGVTLRQIADTIHPYPTYGLGNRRAADLWYIRKQSPTLVRWVQRIFGYRGSVLSASDLENVV